MILLIDNYDSFVYNLARYIGQLGHARHVVRNDAISIEEIKTLNPSHIILSPGPCTPNEAGISLEVIAHFYKTTPILGICLGHQAIGQFFKGHINKAKQPMHGKSTLIQHNQQGIFRHLPTPLKVGLYHSLIVEQAYLLPEIEIIARSQYGDIMALRHTSFPTIGLQFHPESILTEGGYYLLANFLNM
ncbi:MAG TPA: aminodeoxychorismate/anthranilate synthase component II [Legionellaceae bacterium]|nr:aminodeoxychorismate/anthranilate synthase component II [Legionellaceae bacterium]